MKPTHLRKKGTNEIFVYTDMLAKRGDMIPHSEKDEKKDADDSNDPNKTQLIVEAIDKLTPEDFATNGLPKCGAIAAIVGSDVSPAERNEAWDQIIQDKE